MIRLLCLLILLPCALQAETVVAGLSRDQVSITANFDGSDILIYGAVKRERPIPSANPLQVIITVTGPREPVTVRKKARRFGIWVNTEALEIYQAPSFYAVATTGPMDAVLRPADDALYKVTTPLAIRLPQSDLPGEAQEDFRDALIRIRSASDLYQLRENAVKLYDETLFSTQIDLPANLVEGDYTARIYLTRAGIIIDEHTTVIQVTKVGLERWIYNLAHQQPLIYGLLSLFIAILAGWIASAVFRYIRI